MTMTSMTGAIGAASVAMPTTLGGTQVSSLSICLSHMDVFFLIVNLCYMEAKCGPLTALYLVINLLSSFYKCIMCRNIFFKKNCIC
jgi:hypothetical protein